MPQDGYNLNPLLGEHSEGKEFSLWDGWLPAPKCRYPIVPNVIKRVNVLEGFIFPVRTFSPD